MVEKNKSRFTFVENKSTDKRKHWVSKQFQGHLPQQGSRDQKSRGKQGLDGCPEILSS